MSPFIELLRPKQWVKNVFVLLPVFFSHRLTDVAAVGAALLCAVAFSLAASAVYCLNDVLDREADARPPRKCRRPIASGRVSSAQGVALGVVCAAVAVAMVAVLLPAAVVALVAAYLLVNALYSLRLKHVALVDVLTVAVFYVMRVQAGAWAAHVEASQWIVVMTYLLALFLVLGKRRDDVVLSVSAGSATPLRRASAAYNADFLNVALTLVATVTLVAYLMYTISPEVTARFGTPYVYFTAVFVLAGILRYLQLAIVEQRTGSPTEVVLHDRFTQCCLLGWAITFGAIIYL